MKYFILILSIIFISSCGIFKNRTVKVVTKDSIVTVVKHDTVHEVKTFHDTTHTTLVSHIKNQDSTTTEVQITPVPGIPFTYDSGKFIGQASKVNVITKNKKDITTDSKAETSNGISIKDTKDSSSTLNQKTDVKSKTKDITSKANYSWIIYLAVGLIILAVAGYLVFKFILKKAI